MNKKLTPEQLRATFEAEMQGQNENRNSTGTTNPMPAGVPGAFEGVGIIRLKVVDVDPYEDNPRTVPNAQFETIKESIRTRGLDQKLVVTKRPGAGRYILAKGGKTRLQALKELAAEDPKFAAMDFDLVPYKSESELLVAHMVENEQRDKMTFYDTARGYLMLRDKRSRELGREIAARAFSAELKALGLPVDNALLGDFDFLVTHLSPLGELAKQIARDNVRNQLRPQHGLLHAVRELLKLHSEDALTSAYADWLRSFAGQSTVEADQTTTGEGETEFAGAAALLDHIEAQAAQWLGLSQPELKRGLAALGRDRKLDAAALSLAITGAAQAPAPQTPEGGGEAGVGSTPTDSTGGQFVNTNTPPVGGDNEGGRNAGTHDEDDYLGDGVGSGYQSPRDFGDKKISGRSLATLKLLDANGKPIEPVDDNTGDSNPTDTNNQGSLPGTSSLESAQAAMRECIMAVADFAGVMEQLRDAPGMPLGYFMDLPSHPLGAEKNDYAVQAWWFLSNLACQFTSHYFNLTGEVDGQTVHALYDTGPDGFRAKVQDQAGFEQYVATHLGGTYATEGFMVLDILTDLNNPLAEMAQELVRSVAEYRLHRG